MYRDVDLMPSRRIRFNFSSTDTLLLERTFFSLSLSLFQFTYKHVIISLLVAMSTTLSIPPSCLTEIWLVEGAQPTDFGVVLGNPNDDNCWPGTRDLSTTFSPALCPSGYTIACNASPTRASETAWACCPSGFICDGGTFSCLSNPGMTTEYSATMVDRAGNTVVTSWVGSDGVNAHSVRVAFRASDVVVLATASSSSSPSTTTSTAGLSPGATAGLGVGVGIAAFLLLALATWMAVLVVRKRRRARNSGEDAAAAAQEQHAAYRGEMDAPPGLHELGHKPKEACELPDSQPVAEVNRAGW
ncbi:hypothetical protein F5X96DRAFT_658384 [Biscogniauxia mediterranea]|nr:hypothetical protein F5X96DRAFT_658384 [Biscogniauxia mediterranea]